MDHSMNQTLIDGLHWRYATKKFDPTKKISDKDWATLQESLRLAPSSYGLQPWQFVIVQSPDLRKKLTPVSYGQPQIEGCSHLVVVTRLKTLTEDYIHKYFQQTSQERGIPMESLKGYHDMIVGTFVKGPMAAHVSEWTAKQAYISMGVFMTAAALLKVDVCPMEGIDAGKYDEILGLKDSPYGAVAVLATGYRAAEDGTQAMKKVRFPAEAVIKTM